MVGCYLHHMYGWKVKQGLQLLKFKRIVKKTEKMSNVVKPAKNAVLTGLAKMGTK
jgi:hypothetical protein